MCVIEGVCFYLESVSTLSPDFILRPILTIEPFTSLWDEGSTIILRLLYAKQQVTTWKPLFPDRVPHFQVFDGKG